ncbi:MAG: septum site-determining protein Ssd [Actinomycetota bacterium]
MSPASRPLVLTADERLLDDVLRLAAAAGVEVDLVTEAGAARARWPGAPLVVVGDDQAGQLLALGPPRRQGVVLVCLADDGAATWRRAVGLGAERVVRLPAEESLLVDAFADVAEGAESQRALVLGVVGGRGGAGASVLAAALAMTGTHRGLATMLIDVDPLGGGLDLVMGAEHSGGLRWPDLADTRGRVSGSTLRGHLPEPHGLTVLSWDRGDVLGVPPEAMRAVTAAARRSWELVVLDLPRRLDAATEEALAGCGCVLLVVPAEVRAVAAASRVAAGIGVVAADIRVVVRSPSPSGLRAPEVAAALGLPLAAQLDAEPGLVEALERGEPPCRSGRGPLADECGRLLEDLRADGTRAA